MVDWSSRDSFDDEVCETTAFVSEINRLIIINNYLLIAHSLNEKHAASMPTMKDGIDAVLIGIRQWKMPSVTSMS